MTREELIEKIRTCKTQKEAFKLAARLVALHTKGRFRISTLEKKIGEALCEHETWQP